MHLVDLYIIDFQFEDAIKIKEFTSLSKAADFAITANLPENAQWLEEESTKYEKESIYDVISEDVFDKCQLMICAAGGLWCAIRRY